MMRKFFGVLIMAVLFFTSMISMVGASSNTSTEVMYGDNIKLYFDEREWKLGADNVNTNVYYEYVTDGQNINEWKELVTLQMFKGVQETNTAEAYAKWLISSLYKSCGDKLAVSVIRNNPSDYMVEWKVTGHPQIENQHEIDRIIKGKESMIVIHYAKKTSLLSPIERAKWGGILDKATIQ